MASNTLSQGSPRPAKPRTGDQSDWLEIVKLILTPIASLKFTVALFALSIFLVLAGTLAQVSADINTVMDEYFRSRGVWIPLKVFFPPSFFPPTQFPSLANLPGSFPFPGGWTIGGLLFANLLAAHGLRFKPQARGTRLSMGLGVIALGVLTTWMVIASGSNKEGIQGQPLVDWDSLWVLFEIGLAALCAAVGYVAATTDRQRTIERWSLFTMCGLLAVFLLWLISPGQDARISDASMRITWQLIKATFAALVLLVGCALVFKKRAGIVLLHTGVGLIMFNELYVGLTAVEAQIQIEEGQTVGYAQDIREVELAVIDRSGEEKDTVTVIPESMLTENGRIIRHELLPFDVQIVRNLKNSNLVDAAAAEENPADAGFGRQVVATPARPGAGTDTGGQVDVTAVYVNLTDKEGLPLGTWLMRQFMLDQEIAVSGRPYDVALRFKRIDKPYSFHLFDVRKDDYVGTSTPKNYSSHLRLVDPTRDIDRPNIKIWMNNPLRYAGETFYQSNYAVNPATGKEVTTLSVVTNAGWMIPYVGCMIVAVGMVAQFYQTLARFLSRRRSARTPVASKVKKPPVRQPAPLVLPPLDRSTSAGVAGWVVPAIVVALAALLLAWQARPPRVESGVIDLEAFGRLPVAYKGRVKPLDSLARNSLRIISNKESFTGRMDRDILIAEWPEIRQKLLEKWPQLSAADLADFEKEPDIDKLIERIVEKTAGARFDVQEEIEKLVSVRYPAIRWLADVMTDAPALRDHRVFRIENGEVRDTLKLKRREGMRYSVGEMLENIGEFETQVRRARQMEPEQWNLYERKLIELDNRIRTFTLLNAAFRPPPLPALPSLEEFHSDPEAFKSKVARFQAAKAEASRTLRAMEPPCLVPVDKSHESAFVQDTEPWKTYAMAWSDTYFTTRLGEQPPPSFSALNEILVAYRQGEVEAFNEQLAAYQARLKSAPPAEMQPAKLAFEAKFNRFAPFFLCTGFYLAALLLAASSWLGWSRPLGRASFALIALTFVVHSFALIGRMYISRWAPVTNLYSSAIFIGLAAVVAGLALEAFFRMGIGNFIAALAGFLSLGIAYTLSFDGDTMIVMQAVLDTQFWLNTHVVCVTLGYAATFVAGLLGVLYILGGLIDKLRDKMLWHEDNSESGKLLARMTYGTICFAIFFSFFGTVLGGLWADDSWGRFWGWDPKENGALVIVIWNALVLHARWGGMIKDRGLAVLAVGGNIATSWSWFGVNELGVGLHSYGFTEGVLLSLGLFVASQLAVIALGVIPLKLWTTTNRQEVKAG